MDRWGLPGRLGLPGLRGRLGLLGRLVQRGLLDWCIRGLMRRV